MSQAPPRSGQPLIQNAKGDLPADEPSVVPETWKWNLRKIRLHRARACNGFKEATRIKVAILDTGVDNAHPDLAGRIRSYHWKYRGVPDPPGPKDIVGHGTHIAGIIAANFNRATGMRGICQPELHVWKIFGDRMDYSPDDEKFIPFVEETLYQKALAACLDTGVNVVNLSFSGLDDSPGAAGTLIGELVKKGVTVVAAMGNDRRYGSPASYPAFYPGVIAVGATDHRDLAAHFSSSGSHISLCAPGTRIRSTLPTYRGQKGFHAVNGRKGKAIPRAVHYGFSRGTSQAAAHVSAAAALLLAKHGGRLSGAQVKRRLEESADFLPAMHAKAAHHIDYGHGRLNLFSLLK